MRHQLDFRLRIFCRGYPFVCLATLSKAYAESHHRLIRLHRSVQYLQLIRLQTETDMGTGFVVALPGAEHRNGERGPRLFRPLQMKTNGVAGQDFGMGILHVAVKLQFRTTRLRCAAKSLPPHRAKPALVDSPGGGQFNRANLRMWKRTYLGEW